MCGQLFPNRVVCYPSQWDPLPGHYFSISKAFRVACADEIQVTGVEVVSALGGIEIGWIAVLPSPGNLGSWLIFERIGRSQCNGRCPDNSLKKLWIFVWIRVYTMYSYRQPPSHPVRATVM